MNSARKRQWILPVILASMTLITSALLMFSHELTINKIDRIKIENKLKSLKRLMPNDFYNNDLLSEVIEIYEPEKLGHRKPEQLFIGKLNEQITVMAIPVTAQNGYSGDIDLLVGILSDGTITAVEIIAHKETPGLGDLIERRKSNWLEQFHAKSLNNPSIEQWRVKKDQGKFDQITAATITPRAVVGAIKNALLFHKQYILENAGAMTNE